MLDDSDTDKCIKCKTLIKIDGDTGFMCRPCLMKHNKKLLDKVDKEMIDRVLKIKEKK